MRAAGLLVALVLWSVPAWAGDALKTRDAQVLLDRGTTLYEAGRFEEAIEAYRQGYEIEPHPAFLYAWAQAERQSGDCTSAVGLYEKFLKLDLSPAQRAAGEQNLERCREAAAAPPPSPRPVEAPPAAAPEKTPAQAGPTPTPDAPASEPRRPESEARRAPKSEPTPAQRSPWYTDFWGDALTLTGVLAAGTGVGLYVSSEIKEDEAQRARSGQFKGSYDQHEGRLDRARTERLVGLVGIGAGAVLIGAGVLRYALRAPPEQPVVGLWVVPGSAGAQVEASF